MSEGRPGLDLAIVGGTVVDGSGRSAFRADVGIAGQRIVSLGKVGEGVRRTIDASGLVVAPGFIDVHAHDDLAVIQSPGLEFKVMQGVTTDVVGNCGMGVAPVSPAYRRYFDIFVVTILGEVADFGWTTTAEYYAAVERVGPSANVACLVPHGLLRLAVMGTAGRSPSDAELAEMKDLLAEALAAGGIGLSTGLIYPPGIFASTEELIELCRVVASYGGVYASHIRDEGDRLLEAVEEAIRIGEEAGVAVEISHHKASGRANWGKVGESLGLIDQARARGLDVTVDVYPYTAGSTVLGMLVAGALRGEAKPDEILIASASRHPELDGKTLDELGRLKGMPPLEAARGLLQEDPSVVAILFSMAEEDVRQVMRHPAAMFGSDGLPSAGGKPHPRLYGTFARVLGTYVREEGVLTLEEAVHKMTALPAAKFRLAERGQVAPGYYADLTVFDAASVADLATYQEPRRHPAGIRYVIVNGEVVVDNSRHTGRAAGRVLRGGR
ncbi:MAG: N-acyl-D-amino-acid deacylase family protein [Dehalococcoidia bacterium]